MNGTMAQTAAWSPVRTYALEAKYEFLKLLRMPGYAIPSIAFPAMFYLLFGVLFGRGTMGGVSMPTYLIATYGAFGVIGASLFGFGVGVAVERGQGWMLLKRASPMPPMAFFVAKLVMCTIFAGAVWPCSLRSVSPSATFGCRRRRGCGSARRSSSVPSRSAPSASDSATSSDRTPRHQS